MAIRASFVTVVFVCCLESASAACAPTFERIVCDAPAPAPPKPWNPIPNKLPEPRELKPPFRMKAFHYAELAALSGVGADIASSWGCTEGNPILRNADGRFGARGLAVKAGISGGAMAIAHILHRRYPSLDKPLGIVLGATGGLLHATAIRNRSFGCH